MLELKIGKEMYKLEYSIEASLYDECVERATGLMCNLSNAEGKTAIRNVIDTLTDLPKTALSLFYAGLLEHYGEDGDCSVLSKEDAKKLLKQYLKEHKEDEEGSYYSIIGRIIEQMHDDGFFKLIGLVQLIQPDQTKEPKKPQDHKRKQTKEKATEK